ncbi:MAG: PIN domain-containing protein [Thermodesulfovibrionia bacterium]
MKGKKVLIDTSIWIDYFKNKNLSLSRRVDDILSTADVYVPRIVIAELIQGAKSDKEISVIEEFIGAFNIVDQQQDTWIRAGKLSNSLKKKGITVNLTDCYIALIASENYCRIFTLDEHFKNIKKILNIDLI